jgi:hypothetical protein
LSGMFFDVPTSTSIAKINDQVKVRIRGKIGDTYDIASSPDLKNWTPITSITLTETAYDYTEAASAVVNTRFYRAVKR